MDVVEAIGLGAVAGVLAGLFGVGGGILFVPTLVIVTGLSQIHAQGTSLLAMIPTVAVATWLQHRYGNVRWRAGVIVGLGGIAGVVAGGFVAESLPQHVLRRLFGVFVLAIAAHMAWRALRPGDGPAGSP